MKSAVSVVIVNCNGKDYVDKCVKSIINSNSKDYQIVVVDNGSKDGSVALLKDNYSSLNEKLAVVALSKNFGPARARNEGMKLADSDYVCFLDNDTEVHPDWAIEAIKEFQEDEKIGIIQCKLVLAKERDRLDYVGEYLGQNGFLVQRAPGGEIDTGQYDKNVEILAAKSAGMFIRKKVFDEIGGFDDDYFIYVEETDLGWRSWLLGYKNIFVYKSVVYHECGTSSITLGKTRASFNAKFHGSKNYILTLYKNLETRNLFGILLPHILLWLGLAGYNLLRGRVKEFSWIIRGIVWNLLNLPRNSRKRALIQRKRVRLDDELFKVFMRRMPFSYFLSKATLKQKIGNAESF